MAINSVKESDRRTNIWYVLFSVIVSAGVFFYLFSTISLAEIFHVLHGMSIRHVILFVFFSFAMSLCRTWRYSLILLTGGNSVSSVALFLITLVRNFFSDLLPARIGTLIYVYLVQSRLGIPFGAAAASFALSFIFDIFSLALLIVLAFLVVSVGLIPPAVIITGGAVLAVSSGSVLFFLPRILNFIAKVCVSFSMVPEKYRRKLHDALEDTRKDIEHAQKQGIYWMIFLLSLAVRCFKYLSLYALLLALVFPLGFGVQSFPLSKVFLGLCSAELAASLPISGIGGFGAYEGAWSLVFQLMGYSERIAALTSISHHLFTQVYGYSLGGLALLVLLLPDFQKPRNKILVTELNVSRFFWFKFTGVLMILLSVGIFLSPVQWLSPEQGARNNAEKYMAERFNKNTPLSEMITGKIVYQRPDGIYISRIGEKKPKLLVKNGVYPRWSPDGKHVAYIDGNKIMHISEHGEELKKIATTVQAKALCFDPDGRSILFTDGKYIRRVELEHHKVTMVLKGGEFLEVDVAGDATRLAATVRTPFGFRVRVYDLQNGTSRTVASGCSASLSPDGSLVTVNGKSHRFLNLHKWQSLEVSGNVNAPENRKFDNQFWSNSQQWLVSTAEGEIHNIYVHNIQSNISYRITDTGDCDRADLFVSGKVQ